MGLTNIGSQKTPGRPTEITFAASTGLPDPTQVVMLIGHKGAGGSVTGINLVVQINNVADITAATTEANAKFGVGSELAKMVIAAVNANAGRSSFPALKACVLDTAETTIPSAAQTAILAQKAEFLVDPYDLHTDTASRTALKALALNMSGAQRVSNNQFGTFVVGANQSVADPATLVTMDTPYIIGNWLRNTGTGPNAPVYSNAEIAAAAAAVIAANPVPFNPLDDINLNYVPAPALMSDWPTVGGGLESEACLNRGWTPLYVKPTGDVAFVRTVTGRISADGTGTPLVTSYYDVQDFQVLYFWRKTVYTRFSQPDFKQVKASNDRGDTIRGTAISLALVFEDQDMFQAVAQLSKMFKVERNVSDRSRFDLKTPVNVIPGLHVIATNIEATTAYDTLTI